MLHKELLPGVRVLSHFSRAQLFAPIWTTAHQASLSMPSPGKNTGVGCHFRLQGIFPTQESNLHLFHLLYYLACSLPLGHLGGP